MDLTIFVGFFVGLVIFLYGIENFSREIVSLSGARFRKLLAAFTRNRWNATLLGTFVTSILQSSTATTVITVSLVSGGLISFGNSLGIIFGANIGTTITAQLIAFKVTKFAPLFIIIGFLITLLGSKYRYIGKGIFYFGLLFFGLLLISDAVAPVKSDPRLINLMSNLSSSFISLMVGVIVTAIVQSSSVTTGIVIILSSQGLLSLEQAVPCLLGTNIGTTVTTLIASSQMSLYAKKSSVAHALFNIIGVLLIFPFLNAFIHLIELIGGNIPQQIANAHTVFNVAMALLFLIFLKPFQRAVDFIVKGKEEEILLRPKYLIGKLPEQNAQAFHLIEKEIQYAFETVYKLHVKTDVTILQKSKTEEVDKLESLSDLLDEEIEKRLLEISRRSLAEADAERIILLIRLSNYIEQLGDIAEDIHSLPGKVNIKKGKKRDYISLLSEEFQKVLEQTKSTNIVKLKEVSSLIRKLDQLDPKINKSYKEHLDKLKDKTYYSSGMFVEYTSLIEGANQKLKEILNLIKEYQLKSSS